MRNVELKVADHEIKERAFREKNLIPDIVFYLRVSPRIKISLDSLKYKVDEKLRHEIKTASR